MGKGVVRHHDLLSEHRIRHRGNKATTNRYDKDLKVVLFGAGNVSTHLGKALHEAGHEIVQVWSRTQDSAMTLASSLGCEAHIFEEASQGSLDKLNNADYSSSNLVCIISVKDDAIAEVATRFIPLLPNAIWVHTAGSVSIDVLNQGVNPRYGVFYPMQTFSKSKPVDFTRIGIFTEAVGCDDELTSLAKTISSKVYILDGDGRKRLHLAAVFACNFVNHCYALSETLLADAGIPFEIMLPLVEETADKVHHLSPRLAQTGPAARHDMQILESQRNTLAYDPSLQDLYDRLSQSIIHLGQLR